MRYLRDHHVPIEARSGLSPFLKSLPPPGVFDPESAVLRADGSPQHDRLRIYEGFAVNTQISHD
ncbi:hypothetical protein BKA60DRAFT_584046 [Fusarium oxysporum]|nr:hypothetical protein BKA60DRAFT_584046 [Fusarium oxysporum]